VSQGYLPLAQDAAALDSFQRNQAQEAAQISAETDPQTRAALARLAPLTYPPLLRSRLSSLEATLSTLKATAPTSERAFLDSVQTRVEHVARDLAVVERATAGSWAEAPPPDAARTLATAQDSLARELRALRAALDTRTRAVVEEAERRDRRRGVLLIGLSVAAIAVGLLATALSARSLRPVRALIAGVGQIRRGDYTAQLNIRGDDEISQLGREFDAMTRALEEREQALARQQQALLRAERLAAVGRVSAQVAHEVRNPLSSIGLNVEMLQDALATPLRHPAGADEVRMLPRPSPGRWIASPRRPSATCAWPAPPPRRSPPRTSTASWTRCWTSPPASWGGPESGSSAGSTPRFHGRWWTRASCGRCC
jgi:signal transduction histidine kinase